MKKIVILLACFFALTSFKSNFHKYYLSVTDVEYKAEKQELQIISRVFTNDFEDVLRKRYSNDIRLAKGEEEGDVKQAITRYLHQKLHLNVNGQDLEIHYLGKEYDADQVVMYIEVENVEPFKTISVTNLLLTDMYDDQKNVVNVNVGGETKSLLLSKGEPDGTLEF